MNKPEIVHLATNIYEEALTAASYWSLINQYQDNVQKYNNEMNYSPAFYHVIYQALIESLFMNLSKIYDSDNDALTIRTLLSEMNDISVEDFAECVSKTYRFCGNKFQHRLEPQEECFFKERVAEQRSICNALEIEYLFTEVELSFQELIDLYTKKLHSINPSIQNLINQRNKIYAHNDRSTNFNFENIHKKNPIIKADADKLIDIALDISCFCIEVLTGVSKARDYININDWESSLKMITIGQKYQDDYLKELCDEE